MALADDFKDALSSWATGVSVVTARAGDLAHAVTVSSFTSLSLSPPLILVCLSSKSRLPALARDARVFAVSILSAEQADLSARFARSGREPAAELDAPTRSVGGIPVLADAIGFVTCALDREIEVGDHIILVGRVTGAGARASADPLLYFRRRYRAVGDEGPPADAFLGLFSW